MTSSCLVEEVLQGATPVEVLDEFYGTPTELSPMNRPNDVEGQFPTPTYDRVDPSYLYNTTFNVGGKYPHKHVLKVDADGNGETDHVEGSHHTVVNGVLQPDPVDGHTHDVINSTRRDVPTSHHSAGQDVSYHTSIWDPGKGSVLDVNKGLSSCKERTYT